MTRKVPTSQQQLRVQRSALLLACVNTCLLVCKHSQLQAPGTATLLLFIPAKLARLLSSQGILVEKVQTSPTCTTAGGKRTSQVLAASPPGSWFPLQVQ